MRNVGDRMLFQEYLDALGSELRELRVLQGLSIQRVSDSTGLHQNTISGAERGEKDPTLVSVARMMAGLGCERFLIGDKSFIFSISAMKEFPRFEDVLSLPACRIVSMTGNTVRVLRAAQGISLNMLSEDTGIHPNTIWNIEKGLVNPSLYTLYRLHKGLRVKRMRGCSSGLQVMD